MDSVIGRPAEHVDRVMGRPAEHVDRVMGRPTEDVDEVMGRPAEHVGQGQGRAHTMNSHVVDSPRPRDKTQRINILPQVEGEVTFLC